MGDDQNKICVSIAGLSAAETIRAIRKVKMAEIRIDRMKVSKEEVGKIFSSAKNLIATCRKGQMNDSDRAELLIAAIEGGASYVDVELDSTKDYADRIVKKAREVGCRVILSYHNYAVTPPDLDLENIVRLCRDQGADLIKIACKANSYLDSARLLGLLGREKNLIVIGMGEKGKITRAVAPILGSPFTYASLSEGMETADGQIEVNKLKKILRVLS
jgi:3-dehydroquinate dehydratase-1